MDTDYNIISSITANGTEPVTLAEAKNYIKQDASVAAEDALVTQMIEDAVREAERVTFKQMNTELGISLYVDIEAADSNGNYIIELPYVNSSITIDEVTAIDYEGDPISMDSSKYLLKGNKLQFKMSNIEGYRFTFALTNTITAGQQEPYKTALLALICEYYMNRGQKDAHAVSRLLGTHIDRTNWM